MVGEDAALPLPWLRDVLDATLARQRGHGLLVHGAPGSGSLEFALSLAQAWLCEAGAGAAALPCGRCASCRLVQSKTHPDLKLRTPEETALALGWPVGLDERRKPSRQIRIDEIRSAIDWICTTAARGRAKVLVLYPAEAMNAAAASALLKTLEEPPAGVRLVLCAAEPAHLMPTVRSRCQRVDLPEPPAAQAVRWLAEQGVPEAPVLLAAASGRPLDALKLHRDGIAASSWAALPGRIAAGDAGALAGWPVPAALETLMKLCHDALVAGQGGTPRFFPAASVPAAARPRALDNWLRSLQRVRRHADHPWLEPLLIDALVAEGREALADAPASTGAAAAPLDTLPR